MKSIKVILAGVIFAVVLSASVVIAAQSVGSAPSTSSGQASSPQVNGEWNFTSKFEAMTMDATMTITKNAEGKYAGTWSSQWGESTLSDITLDANKLKFTQTSNFGGQDFKTSYEGTLEGGKLKGTSKNQWGDAAFEGTRGETKDKADPLAGEWQMNIKIPAREIVEKLYITQIADGNLAGKWEGMRGGENAISNLKFADGKLTFTRTSKMGGNDFTSTFAGTVTGDTIKGTFSSDFGEREITAVRAAVKTETPKAEPNKPKPAAPKK
jgi:hypothetical protein